MNERILITGGAGQLGQALLPRLLAAGYQVRIGSRQAAPTRLDRGVSWAQMDLATGEGVETAVADAPIIIHAASSPFKKTAATDVAGTERLMMAANNLRYFFYISIVGVDKIPYRYYQYKVAAEQVIAQSKAPWAILRATQFHSLLDMVLAGQKKLPVLLIPRGFQFQPIATKEVADEIVTAVVQRKLGRLPDLAGPESLPANYFAQTWQQARGLRKRIIQLPMLGKASAAFRGGYHTLPERPFGTITWEDWLAAKYGTANSYQ